MSGEIGIRIIDERDVDAAMEQAQVERFAYQGVEKGKYPAESPWDFLWRESNSRHKGSNGLLDFFNTSSVTGDLHVVTSRFGESVGYNPKDYGNFLWGQAGKRLEFPLWVLKFGAHINNMLNGKIDNALSDKYEHKLLDSKIDQVAIKNGYYFNVQCQENGVKTN